MNVQGDRDTNKFLLIPSQLSPLAFPFTCWTIYSHSYAFRFYQCEGKRMKNPFQCSVCEDLMYKIEKILRQKKILRPPGCVTPYEKKIYPCWKRSRILQSPSSHSSTPGFISWTPLPAYDYDKVDSGRCVAPRWRDNAPWPWSIFHFLARRPHSGHRFFYTELVYATGVTTHASPCVLRAIMLGQSLCLLLARCFCWWEKG